MPRAKASRAPRNISIDGIVHAENSFMVWFPACGNVSRVQDEIVFETMAERATVTEKPVDCMACIAKSVR